MTVRWGNAVAGITCTKCGAHADADRIFCTNCGSVLRPPLPLIQSAPEDHGLFPASPKKRKSILLGFALFVLLDIVLPVIIPDRGGKVILLAVASVLLLGVLLVAFGTITKNRWGINGKPVNCPACGSPIPRVRQPKSLRQALWGGGTCEKCGCEMDKWGRLITLVR